MATDKNTANREERVLTMLHLLGPETAALVLEHLDAGQRSHLQNRLKSFPNELPPVRKQQQIIEEFDRFFKFAEATVKPRLRIHAEEEEAKQPQQEPFRSSGDPLVDLEKMNRYQVVQALDQEQPRTAAILLQVLSPRRAADLLGLMEDARREAIVRELSRNPQAPEIILRKIAVTTVDRAGTFPPEPKKKDDPVARMVSMLRESDKPQRRRMMASLEASNPEQAALISQSLYQFDDLKTLPDAQVQKVLARVDSGTLSTALFGADQAISDKIMGSLSKRARASLQEEMSFLRNVPAAQVRTARDAVTKAIAETEAETE